jgi:flagellar biosynthetic protein FliS
MQNPYGRNQSENYLLQRINNASEEEVASMLLEAAERFLNQAVVAMRSKNLREKARMLQKVSLIMQRLLGMLNPEGDPALVKKLHGIYIWWVKEMFEGSRLNRPEQIERVVFQMDDMRRSWNLLIAQKKASVTAPAFSVEGLVV